MLAAGRWAVMVAVIKAINSNSKARDGHRATVLTSTRGQVLLGAIAAGQPAPTGGQAHAGDRDRQVGVGTTRTAHGLMKVEHVGDRFNQGHSRPRPLPRWRIMIQMSVMIVT